ncbi:MAG: hypothetical protein DSY37_01195 [Hyperthermus sp.]|nr:MAG: hypothetical protein DSY37_01195 [Hyperthermus sp.]
MSSPEALKDLRRLTALLVITWLLHTYPLIAVGAGNTYKWMRNVSLLVPAVTSTGNGYSGVVSNLTVAVAWPGTGTVYVSADPLAELDIQAAARIAALVASLIAGYDYESFDFFVRIKADSPIVGGPSASAAMAVAFLAAFRGKNIPPNFSMTGMVEPDTTIGPVGGVPEKLLAVAKAGVKEFVVPLGQRLALSLNTGRKVDVKVLGANRGVKVVEASTILEAYRAATGDKELLKHLQASSVSETPYPAWLLNSLRDSISVFKKRAKENIECSLSYTSKLPPDYRRQVEGIVEKAEERMSEAGEMLGKGMYYSAASRYFSAAIMSSRACLLAKTLSSSSLSEVTEEIRRMIREANHTVAFSETLLRAKLREASGLTDVKLQLAIVALGRIKDAKRALHEASSILEALESGRIPPTLDTLARLIDTVVYAYYRSLTADQWLKLFKRADTGSPIPIERLKRGVSSYVYLAYSEASYARSLGLIDREADTSIEEAKDVLAKTNTILDYITALTDSIQGYARYAALMRTAFSGEEGQKAVVAGLKTLINLVKLHGITPLLPMMYSEYGSTIDDVKTRIEIYTQAASYALLLGFLSKASQKPLLEPTVHGRSVKEGAAPVTITVKEERTLTTTVPVKITVTETHVSTREVTTTSPVTVTTTTTMWETRAPDPIVLTLVVVVALIVLAIAVKASGRGTAPPQAF